MTLGPDGSEKRKAAEALVREALEVARWWEANSRAASRTPEAFDWDLVLCDLAVAAKGFREAGE